MPMMTVGRWVSRRNAPMQMGSHDPFRLAGHSLYRLPYQLACMLLPWLAGQTDEIGFCYYMNLL